MLPGLKLTTADSAPADLNTRRQFANDLLNLTLASPSVNRHQKSDNDPAEWLPAVNQSWYVNRVIQVRLEYNLTIDQTEAAAIDTVLADAIQRRWSWSIMESR